MILIPAMYPLIFKISVWNKFLVSSGIAINTWQAADILLCMKIMIFANINEYQKIILLLLYSFAFINIVSNRTLFFGPLSMHKIEICTIHPQVVSL
jgi:hypothetical protein